MNDLYWIGPALVSGILAARFGLPPLVGYLITGFLLNVLGFVDYDRLVRIGRAVRSTAPKSQSRDARPPVSLLPAKNHSDECATDEPHTKHENGS